MDITYEGQCTVERVAEFKQQLLDALNGNDPETRLSFAGVTEVDISFFQLLHAAGLSFEQGGKALTLRPDCPKELEFKARMSGFEKIVEA